MAIHNSLRLIDTFTIEPVFNDPSVVTENIVIQRSNGQVRLNGMDRLAMKPSVYVSAFNPIPPAGRVPADEEVMSIYGEYMIVVTDRQRVGQIGEHDIFKLKEYKIMPFSRNNLALSEAQTGEEASYISLLHSHLQSAKLHFAYTYDLTHTLQRQAELRGNIQPMWERITLADTKTKMRSRHRAGTRYFSRGVDIHGNVSNFNESEQIVVVDTAAQSTIPTAVRNHIMLSHVQTRGSIPIFWTQINNIQYTPKLQIFNDPQTGNAFRRHFEAQKRYYGTQLVINLINKKGYEEPMGTTFSKQIDILSDPDIKYYHFDFHHECSKMRWHRVSLLLDHYHEDLVAQGYFKAEANRHMIQRVYHRQSSVVRTNCMDCLDRTNVVQSVISRWVLNRQLQDVGILAVGEQFETFKQFESVFRDVWADNADIISCAYSGTGALKTDFTRTGKRTKVGALYDLQNSIVRYIKNNFLDGSRQDAYDLFLSYDVHENGSYPLIDDRPLHFKLMPLGLIIGFAMLVSCAIIPETNGVYYVNWPRLVPLGYDLAAMTRNHTFESDTTLGTAEVELGWKNE
ncbi:hypothetical protein BX616_007652 [Lobosporangium transversale]|nr:hypothetical protein BX616_007652 [Lobosporangium transversale]